MLKLYLILVVAIPLATAGNRVYRHNRESTSSRDRRANLDYDDIETADQDHVERFDDRDQQSTSERKASSRIGVYSPGINSIQIGGGKSKPTRRLPKAKDSEASGTHFEGTNFAGLQHFASPHGHGVQQIYPQELLNQGLLPFYQGSGGPSGVAGNIVFTGVPGLPEGGGHEHGPILLGGGGGAHSHPHPPGLLANPATVGAENELGDPTKSVYVFSAPPHPPPPPPPHHPFEYVPRQSIPKLPQRLQKHIQLLYINPPSSPQGPPLPPQHHLELGNPSELKTLLYVLLKKPQSPHHLNQLSPLNGINFLKSPPHQLSPHLISNPHKPGVYFIYKNRSPYGLSSSPVGPLEENIPGPHSNVQFTPITPPEELRGNIDYGPAIQAQYDGGATQFELNGYQDDAHLSASQVLSQRGSNREVDNSRL